MMNAVRAVSTDDNLWQAVMSRDMRSDGRFVYAVRSTGIYCRPSCPSRRPKRESVAFYAGPDAAEIAGFREWRRCRPRADHAVAPREPCGHEPVSPAAHVLAAARHLAARVSGGAAGAALAHRSP